jgi:hypothetical protein
MPKVVVKLVDPIKWIKVIMPKLYPTGSKN